MTRLPPDLLSRIDRYELEARQLVEGYLAGKHRSPRHGFATEFSQHREYAPGDDIRHIDWKVFARTERYHLKQYEQETNLVAWFVVDASESMTVGTTLRQGVPRTKYDVASIVAGALAHLVVRQSDSVALQMVTSQLKMGLRPAGGTGRVRELLRALGEGPYPEPSQLGLALRNMSPMLTRRGIVFLISDFLDEVDELMTGLRILRSLKQEVILIQVLDAAEVDFPFHQPTLFRGLENQSEITTDPATIRETYLAGFESHQGLLQAGCRSLEFDHLVVRTDDDLARVLAGYLKKREG